MESISNSASQAVQAGQTGRLVTEDLESELRRRAKKESERIPGVDDTRLERERIGRPASDQEAAALTRATLDQHLERIGSSPIPVSCPTYLDRPLQTGIVHFGAETPFARKVVFPIVHHSLQGDLFDERNGVCAVTVGRGSASNEMSKQQGIYTIADSGEPPKGLEIVACVAEVLSLQRAKERDQIIERVAQAHTITISLPEQQPAHTWVPWDIKDAQTPNQVILAGLQERFRRGQEPPCIVYFCKEFPSGTLIKDTLLACMRSARGVEDAKAFEDYLGKASYPDTVVFSKEGRQQYPELKDVKRADTVSVEQATGLLDSLCVRTAQPDLVIDTPALPFNSPLKAWVQAGLLTGTQDLCSKKGLRNFTVKLIEPNHTIHLPHLAGVIFDVDETILQGSGELVHDGPQGRYHNGLARLIRSKFEKEDRQELLRLLEPGEWGKNFAGCFGLADPENSKKIVERFRALTGRRIELGDYERALKEANREPQLGAEVSLVPGLTTFLTRLDLSGVPIAICTASPREVIRPILSRRRYQGDPNMRLIDLVDVGVYSADKKLNSNVENGAQYSGKAVQRAREYLCSRRGGGLLNSDAEVAMIGDSVSDVMAAAKADLRTVVIRPQWNPALTESQTAIKFLIDLRQALTNHPEIKEKMTIVMVREFGQVALFDDMDTENDEPIPPWTVVRGSSTKFFPH